MPVGTCPGCTSTESGYTGVYDLSGNVSEWEDSCNGTSGEYDTCLSRGGSFDGSFDFGFDLVCGYYTPLYRHGCSKEMGFRCCAP